MKPTHVCDYCGEKYCLGPDRSIVKCRVCERYRIFDLIKNKRTAHYTFDSVPVISNPQEAESMPEVEPQKRNKKQSKDNKAKKTCNSYSMKSKSQQYLRKKSR